MKQRVVVGLSGGVDSSIAAFMLKQQGFDVIGLFMINWHDTTGTLYGDCAWKDDLVFAELVARKLEIPLHTVDLSEQYRIRVVDYMFSEYEKGRTPNPDILCNREIKFDQFVDTACSLDAEFIATGHYARKEVLQTSDCEVYRLLAGLDKNKDQSYFLCQLSQKQLSNALFPIGNITKPQVREIANLLGLATAERKDSQGICFVGKVDLPTFLQQKLEAKEGNIIEVSENSEVYIPKDNSESLLELTNPFQYKPSDGKFVGKHRGAHFYTIGQRKGLNVGGKEKPLFVIATNIEKNIVYTGQGEYHPGLYRKALFVRENEIHWVRPDLALKTDGSEKFLVRIEYRQPLQTATIYKPHDGLIIVFDKPQRGITAGQFAAWYSSDELVGSGVIDK